MINEKSFYVGFDTSNYTTSMAACDESGRIIAAILLLPAAAIISILIKKREIPSIHKRQVLLVTTAIALVCVMIYFLSGIKFGFYKNPYGLISFKNFLNFFL